MTSLDPSLTQNFALAFNDPRKTLSRIIENHSSIKPETRDQWLKSLNGSSLVSEGLVAQPEQILNSSDPDGWTSNITEEDKRRNIVRNVEELLQAAVKTLFTIPENLGLVRGKKMHDADFNMMLPSFVTAAVNKFKAAAKFLEENGAEFMKIYRNQMKAANSLVSALRKGDLQISKAEKKTPVARSAVATRELELFDGGPILHLNKFNNDKKEADISLLTNVLDDGGIKKLIPNRSSRFTISHEDFDAIDKAYFPRN